ncbi:MAG: cache domain-containing protein [Spirochaetes bacterium]|nr:cache domain-containing protein [Spirochaetota bacterium]
MNTRVRFLILMAAVTAVVFGASLAERKQKCIDLVNKAVAHYAKVGADKAFFDISDPKGQFVDGEYYVFAYDNMGKCLAHGQFKDRVGKNFLESTDPNGVKIIVQHIKVAKSAKGEGWDEYSFRNPTTKKIEKKTSFIKVVAGKDFFFGSGTYLE